mgnify:FL=1
MVLLLGLTRVVFAMSRDGLLPRGLSHTGKHGTPVRLQIIVGVVMALIAACCNVGILSDMVNIGTLSAFTLVAISIPIMRKKRPDLERSFKIPGNPWVPILIAIANLWLMVNLSVLTWIRFVVWLIVASPSTSATATVMPVSVPANSKLPRKSNLEQYTLLLRR